MDRADIVPNSVETNEVNELHEFRESHNILEEDSTFWPGRRVIRDFGYAMGDYQCHTQAGHKGIVAGTEDPSTRPGVEIDQVPWARDDRGDKVEIHWDGCNHFTYTCTSDVEIHSKLS